MKVGDKVKVKSWEEILKTLNKEYYCLKPCKDGQLTYFSRNSMLRYLGFIGTISEIHPNGNIQLKIKDQICDWWWHSCWLDLIPKELDVDKDCSSKWLIFCMIFQYLSGNCPNPSIFKYFTTPSKNDGGFNYVDFEYDFLDIQSKKIPFPDWPILNLPLDEAYKILEHCYKYGNTKKNLEFFTQNVGSIVFAGFLWENTPEGHDYWNYKCAYYKGIISREKLEEYIKPTKSEILTTQIKTKNYEIKLQEKRGIILRGTVPKGNKQSSGKYETSIVSRPLGYTVCSGR